MKVAHPSERRRVAICAAAGVVVGVFVAFFEPWQLAVLSGWIVASSSLSAWIWIAVGGMDGQETERFAMREDDSRTAALLSLVLASIVSLLGVGVGLIKASNVDGNPKIVLTVASVVTVVLSWILVHTTFALRYAHRYYTEPVGGIEFPHDLRPDYHDFAYLAFTIGMTFQVSDTDLRDRSIRRLVLRHALLSYLFGTVIVAVTINVVAGLVK